jgi:hypothetical protein
MGYTLTPLGTLALPCVLTSPPLLQGFLNTSTSGGTLAAGAQSYRVSALVGTTETAAGVETSATTTGSTSTVTLSWLPVPGATSYKVYGRTAGAELFMAQVTAPTTTWVDTGAVTPSGALPANGFAEATATPGLYVAPSGSKLVQISRIVVSNPTAWAGNVFLSRVGYGGTGGAANRILGGVLSRPDSYLDGGTDIDLACLHVLDGPVGNAGADFLTGYATVPGLVLELAGTVLT